MKLFWLLFALGAPTSAISYWLSGVMWGFHVWEKIPERIKKYWKIYAAVTLLSGGGAAVTMARPCDIPLWAGLSAMNSSAETREAHPIETRRWRDLGKIDTPPSDVLKRLKQQTDADEKQAKAAEEKKARDARERLDLIKSGSVPKQFLAREVRKRQKEEERQQKLMAQIDAQIQAMAQQQVVWTTSTITNGTVMMTSGGTMTFSSSQTQPIGTRKGPFCRVTCSFHHGDPRQGTGDVELDAEFCQKNRIPPELDEVMGWIQVNDQLEVKQPWPGPAGGGLDNYKLYWVGRTNEEMATPELLGSGPGGH